MSNQKGCYNDGQVPGGESRRSIDNALSEKFGGHKSSQDSTKTVYGNYIEPVLHAVEHTGRGVLGGLNSQEFARAKDELRSVGHGGLRNMEPKYQEANRRK